VWDYYDGPRTGIADLDGQPHYFECVFDAVLGNYTKKFKVYQDDLVLFSRAKEQWAIFREWEMKHSLGEASIDTHPGSIGVNERYDELEVLIKNGISNLKQVGIKNAVFNAAREQPKLPPGCLRDLEVQWT